MLRGINVSGHNPIKMAELKKLYETIGFQDVKTYIQSGNIVFKTTGNQLSKDVSVTIESAILEQFGFHVPVITRSPEELLGIINGNPFRNADNTVFDKIYITFLEDIPLQELTVNINPLGFLPDRFVITGREIYISCTSGYGTTKLSNTFFENKLKMKATTRNWKTIRALVEMAI
jgi:uncharacterized protein (DUF1697 family)